LAICNLNQKVKSQKVKSFGFLTVIFLFLKVGQVILSRCPGDEACAPLCDQNSEVFTNVRGLANFHYSSMNLFQGVWPNTAFVRMKTNALIFIDYSNTQ